MQDNNKILKYSQYDYQQAFLLLKTYSSDFDDKKLHIFRNAHDLSKPITEDLRGCYLNRSHINMCYILNTRFDNATMTGSVINGSIFSHVNFAQANLDYCDFVDTKIINTEDLTGVSFHKSSFINCEWHNSNMVGCAFNDAYFENVIFYDVKFTVSTYENTVFANCTFINCELWNLNLDFAEFINPVIERCTVSLMQTPYVFGLLSDMLRHPKKFEVTDDGKSIVNGEEYIARILPALEVYFAGENEYFPLANIYFHTQRTKFGMAAMLEGIQFALSRKDFRIIKHMCKLAQRQQAYTFHERQLIYKRIIDTCSPETLSKKEYHNFTLHIDGIRAILFENSLKPKLSLTFNTNITDDDADKLAIVMQSIYDYAGAVCGSDHDLKIRFMRNSPISVNVDLIDLIQNIYVLLPVLLVLAGKFSLDIAGQIQNMKYEKLQIEKLKLEVETIKKKLNEGVAEQKGTDHQNTQAILDELAVMAAQTREALNSKNILLYDPRYYIADPNALRND